MTDVIKIVHVQRWILDAENSKLVQSKPKMDQSHQSSVISHQSSVISHQSSVISHQSSVISHQSSVISHFEHNFGCGFGLNQDFNELLIQLRTGGELAYYKMFCFFIDRLRSHIRLRLASNDRAEGFEEDLANETMTNIWLDLKKGRFQHVTDSEELWLAIVRVAKSRILDRQKYLRRKKRLRGHSMDYRYADLPISNSNCSDDWYSFSDSWESFLRTLCVEYREIVSLKMKGFGEEQIAERIKVVPRSVRRKVVAIERKWDTFVSRG